MIKNFIPFVLKIGILEYLPSLIPHNVKFILCSLLIAFLLYVSPVKVEYVHEHVHVPELNRKRKRFQSLCNNGRCAKP